LEGLINSALTFTNDFEMSINENLNWSNIVSIPFTYAIPNNSLISSENFVLHGKKISDIVKKINRNSKISYLGQLLPMESLVPKVLNTSENLFLTIERAVDTQFLREKVIKLICENQSIQVLSESKVVGIQNNFGKIELEILNPKSNNKTMKRYDYVINCAWEEAAFLDSLMFSKKVDIPNLRLRMFAHGKSSRPNRALTATLGPFGDYVTFANGRTYASWYSSGLLGFVESLKPPKEWLRMEGGKNQKQFLHGLSENLGKWIPEISDLQDIELFSRIVVGYGATDIDDLESNLHNRFEPEIVIDDGWISVKSAKFTSAPSAARLLKKKLMELI
jgi:hypothetical protein